MGKKQFKDPVYGYINIDNDIVANIIDTPAFQRLKDIRQTSYTPLFPSAYHNRFVHSLGVYHLGQIAFHSIKTQLVEYSMGTALEEKVDILQQTFELACLLHDVGHAPFSHTGETFFLDKSQTLFTLLKESVDDADFANDFDALGAKKPASHECMSCVVGIRRFASYFDTSLQKSFFSRCIIGMPFRTKMIPEPDLSLPEGPERSEKLRKITELKSCNKAIELCNCIINLLNSSIIDVDRLDYIIRDSATIGFKNAQVDYMRLLEGLRIVKDGKRLCIGYHKNAISVIESAVYAHDAEKKWVQGHPTILYEMEALKNAMSTLTNIFSSPSDTNPLFCYEALTEDGKELKITKQLFSENARKLLEEQKLLTEEARLLLEQRDLFNCEANIDFTSGTVEQKYHVSLLADEDFLHLMKQFCKDGLGYEYFARDKRRTAVWKSEAEFRALFQERIGDNTQAIQKLEQGFESLVNYCIDKLGAPIISESLWGVLSSEETEANEAKAKAEIDEDTYEDLIAGIKKKQYWAQVLKEIYDALREQTGMEFEFLIIFQKKFSTSFKSALGKIPVLFPNVEKNVVPLERVVDVLKTAGEHQSNFFHIYYKAKKDISAEDKKTIVHTFADKLVNAASSR